ncbi:MAG TPA: iron ABC transporter permease [Candidatus Altiarchaeales archaeon]|nr:iron ABC transporter permease [Candidatus Altiarchaeales archaeon]
MLQRFRIDLRLLLKILTFLLFLILAILPVLCIFLSNLSPELFSVFDDRLSSIFLRTLLLCLGTVALSLAMGIPFAFLLEYTDLPFRPFFRIAYLLPLLIPPYISAIAWLEFLGKKGDLVSLDLPIYVYNLPSVIIILALSFFPIVTLITSFALRNIDSRLEDAARLLYPQREVIRRITIPLIMPHILISSIFVFAFSISELGVPALLMVNVFTPEIFAQFSAFFDTSRAIALSIPMVVLIFIIILLNHRCLGRRSFITISSFSRKGRLVRLSKTHRLIALTFISIILISSTLIPIFILLLESRLQFLRAFYEGFEPIINSLHSAILGATLMTLLGFFLAYFYKRSFDPIILFPIAIPSMTVGIAIINFFNTDVTSLIYNSFLIIIIGYTARFLPFVTKTLSPFFEQIHPSIEESALLSGSSFPRILHRILLPLMKPGIISSWVVGFVLSVRELSVTLLVSPAGFQTLPVRIYTLMHYGAPEMVSSLSLILIFLIITPVILLLVSKRLIWLVIK